MSPEAPIRIEYDRPPLVEQAVVVVFEPIEKFSVVDFGLFWSEIQAEFPVVDMANPVEPTVENFDEVRPPSFGFQLVDEVQIPRAMFRGSGEVIQLQRNHFGFNWVQSGGDHYPRSERVMARFDELFERFRDYLRRRGLGELSFRQCEVTNLNVIPLSEVGGSYSDITTAFKVDPLDLGVSFLQPETYVRQRQHRIVDESGAAIGRLHTTIQPVRSVQNGAQAFKLELTARSAPTISSLDEARKFFRIARNAVNGAFKGTVTETMRHRWGERDVQ